MPIQRIETLAAHPEVRSIRPADRAITHMLDVSEGDAAHRADQLRASLGVDGTGIQVGVLSDGVDSLASLQASGDLPPSVTVLTGQAGSGSEGTAMLEIIHDLAPGADLLFATALSGQASFAQNILDLRGAGADVIVDDVSYFAEAVFQDDDIAAAVDTVSADGALYFSSAGNGGNLGDGTSGVWEGDFVFGDEVWLQLLPPPFPPFIFDGHDFGGGELKNEITVDSPFVFMLHWSDPIGASGNDYDLLLVNPAGQLLSASLDAQNGDDDPFEIISSQFGDDTGNKLMIIRESGADRYLHLNALRGRLAFATDGQTSGHSAARGAVSVAAVRASHAAGPGGVFDGSESVEWFSSDGPRRVFYEAGGTPITPGDVSSSGGEVRQKPNLTAADCVSTATPGFATFCGTSAAAPHAAAMAALMLELGGAGVEAAEVRGALEATALDIEAPGIDRDSGAGIADPLNAALALGSTCADGMDNDGDGPSDYPSDPGCCSAFDPTEAAEPVADIHVLGSLDFGPLAVGESVTRQLRIDNVGATTLTVTAITSSDVPTFVARMGMATLAGGFALLVLLLGGLAPASRRRPRWVLGVALLVATVLVAWAESTEAARRRAPLVIPPCSSAQVPVEFTPASAVPYAAMLTIESDDVDEPTLFVALSGEGIAP
jgi:hypothetical protein